ncbi:PIG-L family deacetylase [Patescibacteria group bacterium]|nr:PIG-L family deacetylase [Patescibacteria group bacterium]
MHPEGSQEKRDRVLSPANEFIERLIRGESFERGAGVAVVVAHQDDESIAFGAQLPKLPEALMVHVTDGAPNDEKEWKGKGFKSKEDYAETRRRELTDALNIVGHSGERVSLGIPDQGASAVLAQTAKRLADMFRAQGIHTVLTHAYEGGHPDHDATAFAVHAAQKIIEKEGGTLTIIEAPLYRPVDGVSTKQSFAPADTETYMIPLTVDQQELKQKLYDAHGSQRDAFAEMSTRHEWLREAPPYSFTELPNNGQVSRLYREAGLDTEWTNRTSTALEELSSS